MKNKILNPAGVKRFIQLLSDNKTRSNRGFNDKLQTSIKGIKEQREDLKILLNTLKLLHEAGLDLSQRETENICISDDLTNIHNKEDTIFFYPYTGNFYAFGYSNLETGFLTESLKKEHGSGVFSDIERFNQNLREFITLNNEFINML